MTTEPPVGSDPQPQTFPAGAAAPTPQLAAEDAPSSWGDGGPIRFQNDQAPSERGPNDDRLHADKPPHYG